uniref:Uncharacterized protein n=1 Tax=Tetranychus urticae TaxID=32264 RepID=T1L2J5_TETUR
MDFHDAEDTLDAAQDTANILVKLNEEFSDAEEAVVPATIDHPYCKNSIADLRLS